MARNLKDAVAVITGASSGIGRATALAFADKGTAVVVAARREAALDDLVAEIERKGGRALAVPTDVTDEAAVTNLADKAVQAFGRIDIWVNDAGVILYGSVTDTPMADVRRLMEVNFIGHVHGARAALPVFRAQGNGTLINLSSVVTRLPQPYASAYVASKHAVHALSESLRQELMLAGDKDIHVVNVLPAAIDTPLFQHGGNYTGRRPVPSPPVYPVDVVAKAILKAATHPKRDIHAGRAGHLVNLQAKFMPGMVERSAAMLVDKGGFEDTPSPPTSGNLFEPMMTGADVSGGWRPSGLSTARRLATAGVVGVTLAALARRAWQRQQMIANSKSGWKAKVADTSSAQRLATLGATTVPLVALGQRAWKRRQEPAHAGEGPRRVGIEAAPEAARAAPAPEVTTVTETITITEGTDGRT